MYKIDKVNNIIKTTSYLIVENKEIKIIYDNLFIFYHTSYIWSLYLDPVPRKILLFYEFIVLKT